MMSDVRCHQSLFPGLIVQTLVLRNSFGSTFPTPTLGGSLRSSKRLVWTVENQMCKLLATRHALSNSLGCIDW